MGEDEDQFIRFGDWNKGKENGEGFVIVIDAPTLWRDKYDNGNRILPNS